MLNLDKIIADITVDYYKYLEVNGWIQDGVVNSLLLLNFINDAYKYSEDIFSKQIKQNVNLYLDCIKSKSCFINKHIVKD